MQTFASLFCARFRCSVDDFPELAFKKCLYLRARPLAPLIRVVSPDFFRRDFQFIRYLGEATDMHEVKTDAVNFRNADRGHASVLRSLFKVRVSSQRASRLAYQLFSHARSQQPAQ